MLQSYINKIQSTIRGSLPGKEAQKQMMPVTHENRNAPPVNKAKPKEGSVMILLYQKNDQVYFPLMLRPNYNGVHSGQISLPGGKKEEHDNDFIDTAIRETEEEIGIKAKDVKILGRLTELFVFASNIKIIPVVGYISAPPMFIPNPYEVEAIIETPIADLFNEELIKNTSLHVRGFDIEAPYFDIGGNIVWGATAMVLSEFKALLEKDR